MTDSTISGQALWLAMGAPEVSELDEPQICACCDQYSTEGAPGAGGAPWICSTCAEPKRS